MSSTSYPNGIGFMYQIYNQRTNWSCEVVYNQYQVIGMDWDQNNSWESITLLPGYLVIYIYIYIIQAIIHGGLRWK